MYHATVRSRYTIERNPINRLFNEAMAKFRQNERACSNLSDISAKSSVRKVEIRGESYAVGG